MRNHSSTVERIGPLYSDSPHTGPEKGHLTAPRPDHLEEITERTVGIRQRLSLSAWISHRDGSWLARFLKSPWSREAR